MNTPATAPVNTHPNTLPAIKELLRTDELAVALGISTRTVYHRIRLGMPVAFRARPCLFFWPDVVQWHRSYGGIATTAASNSPVGSDHPASP